VKAVQTPLNRKVGFDNVSFGRKRLNEETPLGAWIGQEAYRDKKTDKRVKNTTWTVK